MFSGISFAFSSIMFFIGVLIFIIIWLLPSGILLWFFFVRPKNNKRIELEKDLRLLKYLINNIHGKNAFDDLMKKFEKIKKESQ